MVELKMKKIIVKPNKKTGILKASLTSFAVSHPRLITMGIYAGVAIAVSAAIGFALYPEQQQTALALRSKGWEEG
jgi:Fe2+ transport system protein FeoA